MSPGKKFEKNEAFIEAWEIEEALWNVTLESYKDRNVKKKGCKGYARKWE